MTSRGYLTDLIESIEEDIAEAGHLEEKIRTTDDPERKKRLQTMLDTVLELRREKMLYLMDKAENASPTEWCDFKHTSGGLVRMVEVYEATKDEKVLELSKKSADLQAMAISLFLGMEFETCARCLADKMLVQQVLKEKSATIESTKGENTDE